MIRREFVRFLLVGFSNTLLSWILFVVLIRFITYPLAYTLSYALSIVSSYFLNVFFVFNQRVSFAGFFKFPLVYLMQYSLGIFGIWLLVGKINVAPEAAMVLVSGITIPATFLASRMIIKPKRLIDRSATAD